MDRDPHHVRHVAHYPYQCHPAHAGERPWKTLEERAVQPPMKKAKTGAHRPGRGLCVVYHPLWRGLCFRRPDLQLLCPLRRLVHSHAGAGHGLQRRSSSLTACGLPGKHQAYDYRSYNNAFYGKYAPVFSNLFELLYLCVMCVAPAVAFATGGATLSQLTGLPYLLCTFLIGIFIFVVAIFGTDLVRQGGVRAVHLHHRRAAGRLPAQHRPEFRRQDLAPRSPPMGEQHLRVWARPCTPPSCTAPSSCPTSPCSSSTPSPLRSRGMR